MVIALLTSERVLVGISGVNVQIDEGLKAGQAAQVGQLADSSGRRLVTQANYSLHGDGTYGSHKVQATHTSHWQDLALQ